MYYAYYCAYVDDADDGDDDDVDFDDVDDDNMRNTWYDDIMLIMQWWHSDNGMMWSWSCNTIIINIILLSSALSSSSPS